MSPLVWIAMALLCVVWCGGEFDENAKDAYYKWFGMSRPSGREPFNKEELASKYRKLARQYHPDKNKDPGAEQTFQKISKAFYVLNDDGKRALYDRGGPKAVENQANGGASGQDIFDEIFRNMPDLSDLFGGMGGRGGGGRRRGQEMRAELGVSLADLYTGRTVSFEYTRSKVCTHCHGTGGDAKGDVQQCKRCDGRGSRRIVQQIMPGFVQQMDVPCNECDGRGAIIKKQCRRCHGDRVQSGQEKIDVEIPAGSRDGEVFRFSEMSHEQPDIETGDLTVIVRTQEHPQFQRDGIHLYTDVHLTLRQALLGFKTKIKHLDGSALELSRSEVTQPEFAERIEGAGMPRKGTSKRGDLFVRYHLILPPTLPKDMRVGLNKLLPVTDKLRDEL